MSVITEKGETTTSYLLIQDARVSDSGKYSCSPSNADVAGVRVHVLANGKCFFRFTKLFLRISFSSYFYCVDLLKENMAVKVKTKRERCINVVPFTLQHCLLLYTDLPKTILPFSYFLFGLQYISCHLYFSYYISYNFRLCSVRRRNPLPSPCIPFLYAACLTTTSNVKVVMYQMSVKGHEFFSFPQRNNLSLEVLTSRSHIGGT